MLWPIRKRPQREELDETEERSRLPMGLSPLLDLFLLMDSLATTQLRLANHISRLYLLIALAFALLAANGLMDALR